MKKKIAACAAALAISVTACASLAACEKKQSWGVYLHAMNTTVTLAAANVTQNEFDAFAKEVNAFLTATDKSVSASDENSCVYKFNAAAAGTEVEIDRTAYELLTVAKEVYEETEGYFNPAVWYCEDLYGFAAKPKDSPRTAYYREEVEDDDGETYIPLPESKYVTAFCELSAHFNEVVLTQKDGKYYAAKPDFTVNVEGDETEYSLRIDLGGIAKGWCADRVGEKMTEAGIEYGYFNFGISSMSFKKYAFNDTGSYTVSSGDPRGRFGTDYATFTVKDASFSTSGDNMQYYFVDGKRYCHVIDPTTGSPVRTGVASVTLIGADAGRADALTTAIMAMGKERAVRFINENLSGCRVFMLIEEEDGCKIVTNFPDGIKIENSNYKIANTVVDGKIVLN